MYYDYIETPVGELVLGMTAEGLSHVIFEKGRKPTYIDQLWKREPSAFAEVRAQLRKYFAGRLKKFDIKLAPNGTDFQKAVWRELSTIGYGETITYRDIACRVADAKASRAVGTVNGQNPICIIVPCHRVIGIDGKLTGYGGGLSRKRFLINHEARYRSRKSARKSAAV